MSEAYYKIDIVKLPHDVPTKLPQHVFAHKEKQGLMFEQTSALFDVPIRTLFRRQQQPEPCTDPVIPPLIEGVVSGD